MGFLAYNPKDKYKYGSLKWDIPMGMEEGKLSEARRIKLKDDIIRQRLKEIMTSRMLNNHTRS